MSRQLLDKAEHLLARPTGPTSADACRAVSTIYYALFHFLAGECCKLFIGDPGSVTTRAWDHLYRALAHTTVDEKCKNARRLTEKNFPPAVIDFATFISEMQWKREKCDYGYNVRPQLASIPSDIALARDHMTRFENVDAKHRRAFAVYILFKENRAEKKIIDL